jgi:hypothetical protein
MPDCQDIAEAVDEFDANPVYRGDDAALQNALATIQALPASPARSFAEVFLVAEWGAIPTAGFRFGRRVEVAVMIGNNWGHLEQVVVPTVPVWLNNPQTMSHAIDALVQILPDPPCGQLSFMSKFLHWCLSRNDSV